MAATSGIIPAQCKHKLFLLIYVVVLSFTLCRSLWLDEINSVWVSIDSFHEVIRRSSVYFGQSPLYYLLIWVLIQLGGMQEWLLRLPSLIFSAAMLIVLYRLISQLLSQSIAIDTLCTILLSKTFLYYSVSVRPYTLGLLALAIALHCALNERSPSLKRWLVFCLSCTCAIYSHYLFSLSFWIFYLPPFCGLIKNKKNYFLLLNLSLASACILCLPLFHQITHLYQVGHEKNELVVPHLFDFFSILLFRFPGLGFVIALGLMLAFYRYREIKPFKIEPFNSNQIAWLKFAFCWWIGSYIMIYLLSLVTQKGLLAERFLLWTLPGIGLTLALLIDKLQTDKLRNIPLLLSAGVMLFASFFWVNIDWRGALISTQATSNSQIALAIASGNFENGHASWYEDPEKEQLLTAVSKVYKTQPTIVRALPTSLVRPSNAKQSLDKLAAELQAKNIKILYVITSDYIHPLDTEEVIAYLESQFPEHSKLVEIKHWTWVTRREYRFGK